MFSPPRHCGTPPPIVAGTEAAVTVVTVVTGEMMPSDYFRRQVFVCYWFEQFAPQELMEKIGVDNVLFETDFPHPTSLFPGDVRQRIDGALGSHSAEVRRKVLWENAAALYRIEAPKEADLQRLDAALPTAAGERVGALG